MDRWSHEVDQFKKQMRDSLFCETKNSNAITVARHTNVYSVGDEGEAVYFIEHGQIKLTMPSHKSGVLEEPAIVNVLGLGSVDPKTGWNLA